MKVTVLAGRVGGAQFLLGVQRLLGSYRFADGSTGRTRSQLTAVVNVGDDAWMFGVRICPDLDCMYTLGGGIDPERGLGTPRRSLARQEELAAYGVQPDWFRPRRPRSSTHLVRSQMLRANTHRRRLRALYGRGHRGRLLPASDDRCRTRVW